MASILSNHKHHSPQECCSRQQLEQHPRQLQQVPKRPERFETWGQPKSKLKMRILARKSSSSLTSALISLKTPSSPTSSTSSSSSSTLFMIMAMFLFIVLANFNNHNYNHVHCQLVINPSHQPRSQNGSLKTTPTTSTIPTILSTPDTMAADIGRNTNNNNNNNNNNNVKFQEDNFGSPSSSSSSIITTTIDSKDGSKILSLSRLSPPPPPLPSPSSIIINTSAKPSTLLSGLNQTINSNHRHHQNNVQHHRNYNQITINDDPMERQESNNQEQKQPQTLIDGGGGGGGGGGGAGSTNDDDNNNNKKPVVMFAIATDLPKNTSHSWSKSSSSVFVPPESSRSMMIRSSEPMLNNNNNNNNNINNQQPPSREPPSGTVVRQPGFKLGKKLFRKKVTTSIAVPKPNPNRLQTLQHKNDPETLSMDLQRNHWQSKSTPANTLAYWLKNSTILDNLIRQFPSLRRRSDGGILHGPPYVPQQPKAWWWSRYLNTANRLQQSSPAAFQADESAPFIPEYAPPPQQSPQLANLLKSFKQGQPVSIQLNQIELIPADPPSAPYGKLMPPPAPAAPSPYSMQLTNNDLAARSRFGNRLFHQRSIGTIGSSNHQQDNLLTASSIVGNRKYYPSSSRLQSSPYSYYAFQQSPRTFAAAAAAAAAQRMIAAANNHDDDRQEPNGSSQSDLSIASSNDAGAASSSAMANIDVDHDQGGRSSSSSSESEQSFHRPAAATIYQTRPAQQPYFPGHHRSSSPLGTTMMLTSSSTNNNNVFKQNFLQSPPPPPPSQQDPLPFASRIRPAPPSSSSSLSSNFESPPIIKFSVKDGVNENGASSSSLLGTIPMNSESRSFHSTSSLFDDDGDDLGDDHQKHGQPRSIKMGSFLKPRSLWRSGDPSRVLLEKYDMSDIFCKTKFKPMINPPSAVLDISRNGRQLKRSSSKNEEQNVAIESKPIRFVNSEWTPLAPPKFRLARRLGIQINKNASLDQPDNSSSSSNSTIANGTDATEKNHTTILVRAKRQIVDASAAELETIIGNLPPGAVIKQIDPATTELLLRLLRNTNASDDIARKKITKVYYVYLGPQTSKAGQRGLDKEILREPPQTTTTTTTTVMPVNYPPPRHQDYHQSGPAPYQQNFPISNNGRPSGRRPRPSTTTTTTTRRPSTTTEIPRNMRPKFVLSEDDYEYGEILCEGRFNGGMPDLRNDCRLYFECNPNTIDTYACPEAQRFDLYKQQCVPEKEAYCPRMPPRNR